MRAVFAPRVIKAIETKKGGGVCRLPAPLLEESQPIAACVNELGEIEVEEFDPRPEMPEVGQPVRVDPFSNGFPQLRPAQVEEETPRQASTRAKRCIVQPGDGVLVFDMRVQDRDGRHQLVPSA
jgi:hypothetical protein